LTEVCSRASCVSDRDFSVRNKERGGGRHILGAMPFEEEDDEDCEDEGDKEDEYLMDYFVM